jgi:phage tail sheath protein FI
MSQQAILYVMAGAVVVSALALVLQALMMLALYKSSVAMSKQVVAVASQVESFVESTQRTLEQSRKQIADVAAKAGAVLDLTQKQLVRIDDVLGEATYRARVQMDRIELVLDDSLSMLQDTTAGLRRAVLRPVREITGLAAGLQAALSFLFRSERMTVEQATHDEEMFI